MVWWPSVCCLSLTTLLQAAVAQLSRPFVCLLSLLLLPKGFNCESLAVVGSKVGIKVDGLLVSGQRLLVAFEDTEGMAHVEVGRSTVGVQADGLLVSGQRLLRALEVKEDT